MFAQLWNSAFLFCFCFSASSTNAFDKSWSITTEIKHIGWQCELYVMQHYRANTTHTMKYNRNNKHQDHIELHDPRNIFLSHICEAGASLEQWKKKKTEIRNAIKCVWLLYLSAIWLFVQIWSTISHAYNRVVIQKLMMWSCETVVLVLTLIRIQSNSEPKNVCCP